MNLKDPFLKDKFHWRHTSINFRGPGITPKRTIPFEADQFDFWFKSPKEQNAWRTDREIGVALALDWPLNYCRFFIRTAGRDGFYEREGKKHKAYGDMIRYEIENSSLFPLILSKEEKEVYQSFREFLLENGWENYFEPRPRYLEIQKNYVPITYWALNQNEIKKYEA